MKHSHAALITARVLMTLGSILSIALLALMIGASPWSLFREQGAWLMQAVWGQIALLDLYSGFFITLALIWLLEPRLDVRLGMSIALPLLGNPIAVIWLLGRWRFVTGMATRSVFD